MRAAVLSAVVAMVVIGCGAPKEKQPEATRALPSPPPDSSTPAMAVSVAGDSAKRASPKASSQAEAEAGENALRDSAFSPKFTVDPTGKVVPVKQP